MKPGRAVIVGGGIGGLAAALALARRGWRVVVLERAAEIREIGAGVQISPNAARVLAALDALDRIRGAVAPQAVEGRFGASGRRFLRLELGAAAVRRWGAPYLTIHRADLIEALRAALEETAPGAVRTGAEAAGYDGAAAILTTGERVEGDILIAADGLRSALRAQMLGPDAPRFTGAVAWRALAPAAALTAPPPPSSCVWTGARAHGVTTWVRGGEVANFVGIVDQDDWREEGWDLDGSRDEALAHFEGWSPVVADLVKAAPRLRRWALYDRAQAPRWSDGPAMLIGDAAHPMLPSMAQGAAMALEDAWTLAELAGDAPDGAALGRALYAARAERCERVRAEAAANLRRFHLSTPVARAALAAPAAAASTLAQGALAKRWDWLYGFRAPGL